MKILLVFANDDETFESVSLPAKSGSVVVQIQDPAPEEAWVRQMYPAYAYAAQVLKES